MPENLIQRYYVLLRTNDQGDEAVIDEWPDPNGETLAQVREYACHFQYVTRRSVHLVEFTRGAELARFEPNTEETKT